MCLGAGELRELAVLHRDPSLAPKTYMGVGGPPTPRDLLTSSELCGTHVHMTYTQSQQRCT